ncbi:MAG: branched-chain amino acid ABC transporter permease [Candidatus Poribacteria bacterium]|nr:branched-chain amino acid ABC transporter permease [Candidatus Poribacteria bacterium]
MRDKPSLKTVISVAIVLLLPLLTYGMDLFLQWLSTRGIYVPIPFGSSTVLRVLTELYLYMLLAVGLNVVVGNLRRPDVGFAAFYLVGGYTAGLLMTKLGWNYWIVLVLAAIHGALWGLLRTAITLWLRGIYFAVATFGFAGLLYVAVKHGGASIGAPDGAVYGIPAPTVMGYELYYNWQHYYHILCLLVITLFIAYSLRNSRSNLVDLGGRNHAEQNVESEPRQSYYFAGCAISAAIGAAGGAFFAQFRANINPDAFAPWESILVLCMVVVGGKGSIRRVLLGAGIVGLANEVLRLLLPIQFSSLRYLVFGALAILVMRCCPAGVFSAKRS